MQRKPFPFLGQAAIITLSLGVFTILWPRTAGRLMAPFLRNHVDYPNCVNFLITLTMVVGVMVGFQVGLLFAQRTLWLKSQELRTTFLVASGTIAFCITLFDSAGGLSLIAPPLGKCFGFLTVQALPILWFVYNLHGGTWLRMLAQRRMRRNKGVVR